MNLIEKFAQRIDSDSGYDNLSLAQDLAEIAEEHYTKQFAIRSDMPRFLFGEWVLVDKEKSGQIIECYGNSCIVDQNGMWTEYPKERLYKYN